MQQQRKVRLVHAISKCALHTPCMGTEAAAVLQRAAAQPTNPTRPPPTPAAPGAGLIGMILWPKAKRSITPTVARQIGAVARARGAEPVAVFVDEDAATIER